MIYDDARAITRYARARLSEPTPSGKTYPTTLALLDQAEQMAAIGLPPYHTLYEMLLLALAEDREKENQGGKRPEASPPMIPLKLDASRAWGRLKAEHEKTNGPFDPDAPENAYIARREALARGEE